MINEFGFKTQIKELTVAVTTTVIERLDLWVKNLPATDGSAIMIHTDFNKGFTAYYDKSIINRIIVETFTTNVDDNTTTYKPFCSIVFNRVIHMPLMYIEFESPEGLYVYNGNYQFEDHTGFLKILNNTIGTTFVAGGELL